MSAISTNSFMQGFAGGAQFLDGQFDRSQNRANQREAIQTNREDRELRQRTTLSQEARANEALDMNRQRLALSQDAAGRQDRTLALQEKASDRQGKAMDWQQHDRDTQELIRQSSDISYLLANKQFDQVNIDDMLALHSAAQARKMPLLSPLNMSSKAQDFLALDHILKQVAGGDFSRINEPGNLAIINKVLSDQVKSGIGQMGQNGSKIVDKNIAQLETGPGGKLVATLEVKTEDGKSYKDPLTVNRSGNPDDPVALLDTGKLLDHAYAGYTVAQMYNDPSVQQFIASVSDRYLNGKKDNLPAEARMIEYLVSKGESYEDAKRMAINARGKSVEEQANTLATAEFKAQPEYGTNNKTLQQLREEWIGVLSGDQSRGKGDGKGSGEEWPKPLPSHIDALQKNRGKKADFEAKFGPGSADAYLKEPEEKSPEPEAAGQGWLDHEYRGRTMRERLPGIVQPAEAVAGAVSSGYSSMQAAAREQAAMQMFNYYAKKGGTMPVSALRDAWPYLDEGQRTQYISQLPANKRAEFTERVAVR